MRTAGALSYLLTDHLGSTAVTTDAGGTQACELRYLPYSTTRYKWGVTPTERRFTGQRAEAADYVGQVYDFNARLYSPVLGRFLQADTLVPDVPETALSVLTVNFSNPVFLEELGRENRWRTRQGVTQQQPSWSNEDKPKGMGVIQWFQEPPSQSRLSQSSSLLTSSSWSNVLMQGPTDPQNLNRYTYVRNNSLRYVDPTGYWTFGVFLGGTGFALLGVRGDIGIVIDDEFNVGLLVGAGGGGYTAAGGSAGFGIQITSVPTIQDLKGWAAQLGLGVGAGPGATAEIQFMSQGFGINLSGGPALDLPIGFEVHGTADYSWLLLQGNGRELLSNLLRILNGLKLSGE